MEEEKTGENDVLQAVEKPGQEPGRNRADDPEKNPAEDRFTTETDDLPDTYDETWVVLLPVSPHEVHAYWDVGSDDLDRFRRGSNRESGSPQAVLRFRDVTGISPEGSGGIAPFDTPVDLEAHSGYFPLCLPGRAYQADLGILSPAGQFASLSLSNVVQMPFAEPAPKTVERYDRAGGKPAGTEAIGTMESRGAMDPTASVPVSAAANEPSFSQLRTALLNGQIEEAPASPGETVQGGRFLEGAEEGVPPVALAHTVRPGPSIEKRAYTDVSGGFAAGDTGPSEHGGTGPLELEPVEGVLEVRMAGATLNDTLRAGKSLKAAARLPNIELIAPLDVLEMIRRKYLELHRLSGRMWLFFERRPRPFGAGAEPRSPVPSEEAGSPDLTKISEERFVLGLSSVSVVKQ